MLSVKIIKTSEIYKINTPQTVRYLQSTLWVCRLTSWRLIRGGVLIFGHVEKEDNLTPTIYWTIIYFIYFIMYIIYMHIFHYTFHYTYNMYVCTDIPVPVDIAWRSPLTEKKNILKLLLAQARYVRRLVLLLFLLLNTHLHLGLLQPAALLVCRRW